ncbi:MAG: hypothetical protein OEZ16_09625, partial [Chromatiales bacterium]|nr:hypothetical protein [Chromatiales bacterium]
MPHIIIEYGVEQAEPQRVEELLEAVHRAVAWSGLFDESHIRVRALAYDYYRVAGIRQGFIHT